VVLMYLALFEPMVFQ